MKTRKLPTLAWAAIIVIGFQLYWYLIEVPSQSTPDFQGYQVTHPTTKRDRDIAPARELPRKGGQRALPSELRDYTKYRERMENRGRTEEQISRDYARAIRKWVNQQPVDTYNKLQYEGIDPEYDLHEIDEGLDELVPEY